MFYPLHDGKPVRFISLQWVTLTLIAVNCLVFGITATIGPDGPFAEMVAVGLGHVPSVSNDLRVLPPRFEVLPDWLYPLTGITYAFIHGDIWHLLGNMLFLWVFGDNVEDALGHVKYLIFYFASAYSAAAFHAFMFQTSDAPLIGASGAAAGIIAAYLMLHPRMKIWVLFMGRIPLRLSAFWLLGGWIVFQIVMFLSDTDTAISWASHLGGIVAGVVLVGPLKRREVALFDRDLAKPDAIAAPDTDEAEEPRWGRNKT